MLCLCVLSAFSDKPVVRSSYFQQMMQDAANSMHTANSSVTPAQSSLSTEDNVDKTVCDHHSNTSDADVASSAEHPVDTTKSSQQLIGQIAYCTLFFILFTPPPVGGPGIVIEIFLCLFVSFFVSLSARLRENGWTDFHEIFRVCVE